jgi:alkylation response protein AidB-like acyl-CoA dehydrogenase
MAGLFGRSDEHAILHDTLRRFLRDQADLETRHRRLHATPPDRLALWHRLAELGALGAAVPEALGGFGGTMRDVAVVQDALAPSMAVEPVLAAAIAARLLAQLDPGAAAGLSAALMAGERIFVLAHAEGFDPFAPPAATAVPAHGSWRLRARKPCVRHADVATDLLVTASLPDGTVGVFVVPTHATGLSVTKLRLIDGAGAADLEADELVLDQAARLPFGGDAFAAVTDALEWGLAGLCAETAALIATANLETCAYLNTRVQFGTRLSQFQALAHRVADMAILQEEAAGMAEAAIGAMQMAPSAARSRSVLAASLACDAAGRRVGHEAIQMFGGMGVSDELAISHYGRRLAAIRAQIGTIDARAARLTELEAELR